VVGRERFASPLRILIGPNQAFFFAANSASSFCSNAW
jgi:hypothetical protein